MIDPKSTFISFENNKMLEIIFNDITNLVKKIRKSKKISIAQAAEMSILNTEIMEQFINLINHMTDRDFDDNKESSMIESCLDFQDLCLYLKDIDKYEEDFDLTKIPSFH
ncbi:hypothetical protein [Francisella orientalis]|uniref:Uncharacterized protein n=1 Tax=Francisella orientalis TaxID=299583 RepID=A0AAP7FV56_9GAMM|nr:hypothetical protein [Francisella orientalis]AFJ43803.1 hypothetical protein OOM_1400 [Francisella orientalis str. Toba 04]AHB98344.1 hypothetical protein M973_04720 [Francisella orientalis LADL 07-285A]AKN85502.1 hypothetical protein FNO12_0818 [Francisella orientalis FNO12]AKN87041.1 Hypothetical protein FNO24_0818 [Francisella orientalis FNO24]AKN88579.1 Hypothetical protein FNO190_0818 [Francisella orientalis]